MIIYIIRHGESIGNTKKGFISGRTGHDGLTIKGKSQIIRSAWDLRDKGVVHIYTSPVVRAYESAQIVHSLLSIPVETTEWLTELDYGLFENNYWWNVMDKIPKRWNYHTLKEDYLYKYPEGESFKDVLERVVDGLEELSSRNSEKPILLVTHNAVISTFLYFCIRQKEITKIVNEKEFMSFIHTYHVKNAGDIQMEIRDHTVCSYFIQDKFESFEADEERVKWYVKGMICYDDDSIQARSISTVSLNQDFILDTPQLSYFLKVMNDSFIADIGHYVKLYTYLSEKNIPAPRVVWYDPTKIFFKHETLCYDYHRGVTLDYCIRQKQTSVRSVFLSVYEMIQRIHNLPIDEVRQFWFAQSVDKSVLTQWKDFMGKAIKRARKVISQNKYRGVKKYRKILDALEKYIKDTIDESPIHGDFSSENIIVESDCDGKCNCKRIIDFELVRVGDRLWDYAYLYGWIERIDVSFAIEWKEVLKHKLHSDEIEKIEWYRILFHLWTIADMEDYPGNEVITWRGEQSIKLITT